MKTVTTKSRIVKIVIYIAAVVLLGFGSILTGLFDTVDDSFPGITVNIVTLCRLVVMILLMLILENVCMLVLSHLHPRSNRGSTMITILQSCVRYLAVFISIIWALTILGVNIGTLFAGVGILALIIGFGAESMIADVVTGVFMLFEGQYNVGDVVEVSGFRGTVRSIGIRTTMIEDLGGNVRIVNNSNMTNVLNRSHNESLSVCLIGVPYGTDIERLEGELPEMLYSIYINHTDIFKGTPKYLGVEKLAESSIVLKFIAAVDEANIYNGNRVLNRDLLVGFKHVGVELPFNQLDVHLK